jgi:hypothetical protein
MKTVKISLNNVLYNAYANLGISYESTINHLDGSKKKNPLSISNLKSAPDFVIFKCIING